MQTLSLAMHAGKDQGLPLETCFSNFKYRGCNPRRGQVTLVAAAPGGGKSAIISHLAVHSRPRIPTLYFSAEMDSMSVGVNTVMSLMNCERDLAEELVRTEDRATQKLLREATSHIWYNWDSQPSTFDVADEVTAYAYATGAYPHLIVIDNLINIDPEGASDHRVKDAIIHWFQKLASLTNAAVVILHHVTAAYNDGSIPIPLSGLMDQVAKRPRLVLTLYRVSDTLLGVCIVKNSSRRASPDGSYGCEIAWTPDRSYMKG